MPPSGTILVSISLLFGIWWSDCLVASMQSSFPALKEEDIKQIYDDIFYLVSGAS